MWVRHIWHVLSLEKPMSTFMLFLVYSLTNELEGLASEFEEMYVGVGASRIRKLFKEAKEHVY